MKKIEKNHISEELMDSLLFLYGAGYTAKLCLEALNESGIKRIEALVDDDSMKQGTYIRSYPVISFESLVKRCKKEKKVNIILTSIYGKAIYNKLSVIPNVTIWEMYEWYMEILGQQDVAIESTCEGEKLEQYKNSTDSLKEYLADKESADVFDGIYQYFKTKDSKHLVDICTAEESYFIKEVKEYFLDRSFVLVDAGAYEGELLRAITDSELKVKTWYCFEPEKNNYEQLRKNIQNHPLTEGMNCICENCGLWKERKVVPMVNQGTISRILSEDTEGQESGKVMCRMETIDEYFKDIKVDMIKMDIEGAEMEAIMGGIKTIQRDRPVLAISVYHYVKDYYRIMQYLMEHIEKYSYYIRKHAMIYGETVLYAIPQNDVM